MPHPLNWWIPVLWAEVVLGPLIFAAIVFVTGFAEKVPARARAWMLLVVMLVLMLYLEGVWECVVQGMPRTVAFFAAFMTLAIAGALGYEARLRYAKALPKA